MRTMLTTARLILQFGGFGLSALLAHAILASAAEADSKSEKSATLARGYELFNREWIPNDPRAHDGDGLGPVYNDSSCVACHNSGGSGGAGPVSKNIDILSASDGLVQVAADMAESGVLHSGQASSVPGGTAKVVAEHALDALARVHAGFRTSRTVVLHKFGTDPGYPLWRRQALRSSPARDGLTTRIFSEHELVGSLSREQRDSILPAPAEDATSTPQDARRRAMQEIALALTPRTRQSSTRIGLFTVSLSQRNPTPLFGLGVLDAIPAEAIEAAAERQAVESPEIRGRVSRLKDGRVGRLGWKGQTASAADFVLDACAVELGLEVPDHHQATVPQAPKYQPPGLDLTAEECTALTAYVRSLPRPIERPASSVGEAEFLQAGRAAFASVGCAGCHTPSLGAIQGLYSDLLLHDIGPKLAGAGSYSESSHGSSDEPLVPRVGGDVAEARQPGNRPAATQAPRGATRKEWRTPPLWGFRDSGPYLHDGRAETLAQAVAMHGGQAETSARKFFELAPGERLQVEAFLKSLVAPPPVQLAERGE
jgi:CxxC motif-containing protein (DUF1111 family)